MQANLTPTGRNMEYFNDILDIVRNEKKYSKHIKELQDITAISNEAVQRLTKAKDLDAALKKAKIKEANAENILDGAKAKTEAIINEGKDESRKLMEIADQHINEMDSKLTQSRKDLSDINSEIMVAKSELKTIEGEISEASGKAEQIILKAKEKEKEYTSKLKDLKKRLDGI